MYIHASRGWEYGYAQQAAEANGPGQGHPAGETLQPAYRKDLLLLDTLLHSLPRGPTSRRHGRRGGTRLPGTFGGGAPGGGGHAESGVECARIPLSARTRPALGGVSRWPGNGSFPPAALASMIPARSYYIISIHQRCKERSDAPCVLLHLPVQALVIPSGTVSPLSF